MSLKWKHKIYEKDFSTSKIYKNELDNIIEKIKDDYNDIKHKYDTTELQHMNSRSVDKILDKSEDLIGDYKRLINSLEELRGEIR